MFGILVINRGMWGGSAWVKGEDGRDLRYASREEAQREADRLNAAQGPVNRFSEYFAEEYR